MLNRLFSIFTAGMFVLLTMTATARAALVTVEALDLTFANGFTLTGDLGLAPTMAPQDIFPENGLAVNGEASFIQTGEPDGVAYRGLFWNPPGTSTINGPALDIAITVNLAALPNLTLSDITLSNLDAAGQPTFAAIAGTAVCVSGCSVSAVPIPAPLPLFACAVLSLGAFAWRRRVSG
jgi:hypothetical protein